MIDTDKYENHDMIRIAKQLLIEDAPLLLDAYKEKCEEVKRLREQLVRATKWAYKQLLHNDSAMMDFEDYVWGEEE